MLPVRNAELSTALLRAVKDKKLSVAKKLLANGVQQTQDEKGNSPLHIAAQQNDLPMIALLLKHKADPSLTNKNNKKAIDLTTSKKCLKALINKDSHPADDTLIAAIQGDHLEFALTLLEAKANPSAAAGDGTSALILAVQKEETQRHSMDLVKSLLERKADQSAQMLFATSQLKGCTAIQIALRNSHWEMISIFTLLPSNEEDTFRYGDVLLDAARLDRTNDAIALLRSGPINKNWHTTKDGYFTIHWSVLNRNLRLFKALLAAGFDPEKPSKTSTPETAIGLASSRGYWDFVEAYAKFKKRQDFPLLALKEDCISELTRYTESFESRKKHGHHARANSMIAAFNDLSEEKSSLEAIESILKKGIDAFTINENIASEEDIPHYAKAPKAYRKDKYNTIIEEFHEKLKPAKKTDLKVVVAPSAPPAPLNKLPELSPTLDKTGMELSPLREESIFPPSSPTPPTAAPPTSKILSLRSLAPKELPSLVRSP